MKTLNLTLKREWFNMIRYGDKTEEYREIKDFWCRRLLFNDSGDEIDFAVWDELIQSLRRNIGFNTVDDCMKCYGVKYKKFDAVKFTNGYRKNRPSVTFKLKEISVGYGKTQWGAPRDSRVFILKLGDLLEVKGV